jgi:hypothetical protein
MRGRSSFRSIIFGIMTACCMVGGLRAEEIRHRFVCVDNGTNTLHYIDQLKPENRWSVPIPKGSRDLEVVGEGRILVGHGDGAAEYALKDGTRLWQVAGFNKVQTARRLRDGNTMLGIDGGPFLVVDREGKTVKEIRMPATWTSHLRLARVLENGNILYVTGKRVVEADQTGEIVKTLSLAGAGYTANRLSNGHTIATAGGAALVQQFDAQDKVVHTWGGQDKHPDVDLTWFSGFDVLENGNVVVANWRGHGYGGNGPHIIEFDADNRVVWTWAELEKAKYVTNVLVLE